MEVVTRTGSERDLERAAVTATPQMEMRMRASHQRPASWAWKPDAVGVAVVCKVLWGLLGPKWQASENLHRPP